MSESQLTRFLLLPKLEFVDFNQLKNKSVTFVCKSKSRSSWCPHCGLECTKVHDRRIVHIQDSPHANKIKILKIVKKRFRCCGCKKVHTENIPGIQKRARLTERLQRHILYSCNMFANLKGVRNHVKVASKTIYKRHFNQLELEWRKRKNDPWPTLIKYTP